MQRWCLVIAQHLYIWAFASVGFFEGHSCFINNPDPWLLPKSFWSPLRTLRVLGEWQPSQNIPVNGTTEPTDLRENLRVLLTLEINNFYLVVPDSVGKGASPSIGNICWLLYIYISVPRKQLHYSLPSEVLQCRENRENPWAAVGTSWPSPGRALAMTPCVT